MSAKGSSHFFLKVLKDFFRCLNLIFVSPTVLQECKVKSVEYSFKSMVQQKVIIVSTSKDKSFELS